jgi:monoamine oxidase
MTTLLAVGYAALRLLMLEAQGHDYMLVEARARFGGRIEGEHRDGSRPHGPCVVLARQPRIAALIDQFRLEVQFSEGALLGEEVRFQEDRGFSSMQGSMAI